MAGLEAGRLDRRVTIQRKTVMQSPSGQPIENWVSLGNRFASQRPLRAAERFTAPQYAAKEQVQFEIRYATDAADLTPLDRIVYPPIAAGSPEPAIPERHVYDIMGVLEIGRREGLRILTARRADTIE